MTSAYREALVMLLKILLIIVIVAALITLHGYLYTTQQLRASIIRYGVHPSPEAAMGALVSQLYIGIHKVEIRSAAPDSRSRANPSIQYVVAKVWADSRVDGRPARIGNLDHDVAGTFFAHVPRGWVYIPEDFFVSRGYFGFWLRVFRLQAEETPG
jgi:hypothetical protein